MPGITPEPPAQTAEALAVAKAAGREAFGRPFSPVSDPWAVVDAVSDAAAHAALAAVRADPVRAATTAEAEMEAMKPHAHAGLSLVESYRILAHLFAEVGKAHVAISRSGLNVAGSELSDRVAGVVRAATTGSPEGADQTDVMELAKVARGLSAAQAVKLARWFDARTAALHDRIAALRAGLERLTHCEAMAEYEPGYITKEFAARVEFGRSVLAADDAALQGPACGPCAEGWPITDTGSHYDPTTPAGQRAFYACPRQAALRSSAPAPATEPSRDTEVACALAGKVLFDALDAYGSRPDLANREALIRTIDAFAERRAEARSSAPAPATEPGSDITPREELAAAIWRGMQDGYAAGLAGEGVSLEQAFALADQRLARIVPAPAAEPSERCNVWVDDPLPGEEGRLPGGDGYECARPKGHDGPHEDAPGWNDLPVRSSAPAPGGATEELGWLVESPPPFHLEGWEEPPRNVTLYLGLSRAGWMWVESPNDAVRFARKQDAEAVASTYHVSKSRLRAAEHMWTDAVRAADRTREDAGEPAEGALARGFRLWQDAEHVNSLTCSGGGGPGDHAADLVLLDDRGDRIIATCPTCGFVQRIEADSPLGRMLVGGPGPDPFASLRAASPSPRHGTPDTGESQ